MNHVAIGAEMRKLRLSKGLSQEWIADKFGCWKPYICDLEHGRRKWRAELIHNYKKAVASA